jgi:hypothetical protein
MNIKQKIEVIKSYWGNELVPYSYNEVNKLNLDNITKSFLVKVGTRRKVKTGGLNYIFNNNIICSCEYIPIAHERFSPQPYRFFINNTNSHIYFKRCNENIYHYCNSHIIDFVYFETFIYLNENKYTNLDSSNFLKYIYVRETIDKFREIDANAVHPYTYWSSLMLEYASGYFHDEEYKFAKYKNNKEKYELSLYKALLYGIENV